MTVDEYVTATRDKTTKTVHVKEHKTYYKYGKAHIYLNQEMSRHIETYKKYIRPVIANISSSKRCFFLSTHGKDSGSSAVSEVMTMVWNAVPLASNIGPTLFRKKVVTKFHQMFPDRKKQLAMKMNHTEETANRSYYTVAKQQNSKSISKDIRAVLFVKDLPDMDLDKENQKCRASKQRTTTERK